MQKAGLIGGLALLLSASMAWAHPEIAAFDAPVEIGQWHSNLAAAKAKAQELNIPLLVVWGDVDCHYCQDFSNALTTYAPFDEYIKNRGLIMVYEESDYSVAVSDVCKWCGQYGNWPLLRVTWWENGVVKADSSGWQRPNPQKGNPIYYPQTFSNFKSVLESYISAYSPNPWLDRYDSTNETAISTAVLTWKDQEQSVALKLAVTNNPVYVDTNDWFQLAVESGKTYRVSITNVTGVSSDTPQIAIYGGTNETPVIESPVNLALGNFQFVAATNGFAFVKVWRTTFLDKMIKYTLKYMRYAPGQIQFASTNLTVSERSSNVTLTLKRVGGTSGIAKIAVGFKDSSNSGYTATSGQDFTGPSTVLTWADGDAADKTLKVLLTKKVTQWEGDETFAVTLQPDAAVSPDVTVGSDAVVTLLEVDAFKIQVNTPNPASGSVFLARNVGVFSWADTLAVATDITGKRSYSVYAGASSSSQTILLASGLKSAEINLATNAAFQALVNSSSGKTIYWRVDSVYNTSVSKGVVWAITVLPNGSPEFLDSATVNATNLFVGVQAAIGPLAFTNGLGGTPSVAIPLGGGSLPTGFSLSIRNTNEVWITGVPSRVASGTFVVQLKTKIGITTYPGTTLTVVYRVSALPTYSVGNYTGWAGDLLTTGVQGAVNLSVTSVGGVTGKAVFPTGAEGYSGTYSFTATSFQSVSNAFSGVLTKPGSSSVPVTLQIALMDGHIDGVIGTSGGDQTPLVLFRNNWSQPSLSAVAKRFKGYYTASFPVLTSWPDDAPAGSGKATFTLDGTGGFKVAGNLADGTALTQSGTLFEDIEEGQTNVCALLFSAPTAYQGGLFAGVVCFGDFNTNGVFDITTFENAPIRWSNQNPFSVPVYDGDNPGFDETLDVTGGWYNKLTNLKAFYAGETLSIGNLDEPPAISYTLTAKELDENDKVVTTNITETAAATLWQSQTNLFVTPRTDGSGFTVVAGDLKQTGTADDGSPIYNYDTAVNPAGLRMSFNRTTGIMTGTFNVYYDYVRVDDQTGDTEKLTWAHTSKTCNYSAVLLPERADNNSAIEGDGYYLFNSSSSYLTGAGATSTYTLNYSYRFKVESTPISGE